MPCWDHKASKTQVSRGFVVHWSLLLLHFEDVLYMWEDIVNVRSDNGHFGIMDISGW